MADDKPDPLGSTDAVILYTTFPTEAAATVAAEALVRAGLAACANIMPGIASIYIWEGKLEREREAAMILKSRRALAEDLMSALRKLHPYTNPAIVVVPIVAGSADYLGWIATQTAAPRSVVQSV